MKKDIQSRVEKRIHQKLTSRLLLKALILGVASIFLIGFMGTGVVRAEGESLLSMITTKPFFLFLLGLLAISLIVVIFISLWPEKIRRIEGPSKKDWIQAMEIQLEEENERKKINQKKLKNLSFDNIERKREKTRGELKENLENIRKIEDLLDK